MLMRNIVLEGNAWRDFPGTYVLFFSSIYSWRYLFVALQIALATSVAEQLSKEGCVPVFKDDEPGTVVAKGIQVWEYDGDGD